MKQPYQHKKLLLQILCAIAFGAACGLFFGEYCSILRPIGDIYVMLLQSVVYPYLIASLIGGFGRMDKEQTRKLFKKGWGIYLLLILSTFFVLFILLAGIPKAQSHIIPIEGQLSFWTQIQQSLQLFVPSNPFQALVNNAIPAIVVFSILYGLALQRTKNKESTLVICDSISKTSLQIWDWIVKIAPIGIFALIAYSFGTIEFSQIAGLATYTLLFFFLISVPYVYIFPTYSENFCASYLQRIVNWFTKCLIDFSSNDSFCCSASVYCRGH